VFVTGTDIGEVSAERVTSELGVVSSIQRSAGVLDGGTAREAARCWFCSPAVLVDD
jgi:hypothetical protein